MQTVLWLTCYQAPIFPFCFPSFWDSYPPLHSCILYVSCLSVRLVDGEARVFSQFYGRCGPRPATAESGVESGRVVIAQLFLLHCHEMKHRCFGSRNANFINARLTLLLHVCFCAFEHLLLPDQILRCACSVIPLVLTVHVLFSSFHRVRRSSSENAKRQRNRR